MINEISQRNDTLNSKDGIKITVNCKDIRIALECNRKDVLEMTYDDCDQFQREHFKN